MYYQQCIHQIFISDREQTIKSYLRFGQSHYQIFRLFPPNNFLIYVCSLIHKPGYTPLKLHPKQRKKLRVFITITIPLLRTHTPSRLKFVGAPSMTNPRLSAIKHEFHANPTHLDPFVSVKTINQEKHKQKETCCS